MKCEHDNLMIYHTQTGWHKVVEFCVMHRCGYRKEFVGSEADKIIKRLRSIKTD